MGPAFALFLLAATIFVVIPSLVGLALYTGWRRGTELSLERGRELLEGGQPEQARRIFEKLARQLGRNTLAREKSLYWLGRSYEELGRPEDARSVYRHCLDEAASRPFELDRELEKLMRERLVRLGDAPVANAPRNEAARDYWARFKEERDKVASTLPSREPAVPDAGSRIVEKPPELPVPPERLAHDEQQLAVGRRVGGYVLAEKLGEGGFGEVYRALKPVAIKLARDPTVVEHLRRFGTIQGKVTSERIVKPLEINLEADPPYVVMELVDGFTLRDLLSVRKLEPAAAVALMKEVGLALRDAHEQGVLHLDLKPENVLLDESGKVKLTDFDLGRMTPEAAQFRLSKSLGSTEADAKIAGTIAYMSPEQRDGKVPDQRSDVYTFGVLLFEALTGEHPQPGDKPSELLRALPHGAEVDRIFERCFTRLERRYSSAHELADDLEALSRKLPAVDLGQVFRAAPEARARVAERALAWERREERKPAATVPAAEAPRAESVPAEKAPERPPIVVVEARPAPVSADEAPEKPVRPPIVVPAATPATPEEAPRKAPERRLEPSG